MNSAWFGKDENGNISPTGPYQRFLLERDPKKLVYLQKNYIDLLFKKPKYFAEPTELAEDEFIDNFVGRQACDYLENIDNETPWHLFVSFPGPHNPWDPPKEEVDKLAEKTYPNTPADDMNGKPGWIKKRAAKESQGLTPALLENTKRHYDAAIQAIDTQIGNLLDILEKRDLKKDTVIIFASDHGELMGEHGLFAKSAMYEGAVRVPLLISLPEMTSALESEALASLMDVAPTILELCHVDYARQEMDAVSLLPLLTQKECTLRNIQYSELYNTLMLCDGRYKWIRNYNDCDELYDLQNDPDELNNIIDSCPEIVQSFKKHTFRQ